MQIYISWSGQTSYKTALLLRDLLRKVIPGLEVWISAEDILDGARWSPDLARILNEVTFCIVCVDPSNFLSPWLQFELGVIAKSIDKYSIRVLLHELPLSMLKGPLTLYSPILVKKPEVTKLVEDILVHFPKLRISRYDTVINLDQYWDAFNQEISEIVMEPGITSAEIEPSQVENGLHTKPLEYVNEIGQNIIALISVNEGIEEERIATTMYISRSDALRYLMDLENKALVRSVLSFGIRRWFITEAGRKYLPGVYQA